MSEGPDEFTQLREVLVTVKAKAIDLVDMAEKLDEALGQGRLLERAAKAVPNDIAACMQLVLHVHGAAADIIATIKAQKGKIGDVQSHWERIHKATRATLAKTMHSAAAGEITGTTHKASSIEPKMKVVITDVDLLPLDCIQWVKEPDMDVITGKLVLGQDVPGAKREAGEAGIRIYSKGGRDE